MTVYGIVGTIGSGKTLLMTLLGIMKSQEGSKVYANYYINIPDLHKLDEIEDLKTMPADCHKTILLDEIWLTADSRKSQSFLAQFMSRSVLQSRKIRSDVYYTTQGLHQVDKRIRTVTSIVYLPHIIAYSPSGKPLVMEIQMCKDDIYGDLIPYKKFCLPLLLGKTFVCDLYNTEEIVEQMEDEQEADIKELIEKYKDTHLDKKKLVATLIVEDGLSPTYARQMAEYIL